VAPNSPPQYIILKVLRLFGLRKQRVAGIVDKLLYKSVFLLIVFYIFTLYLYYSTEVENSRQQVEKKEYFQDIDILYNPTAWATSKIILY
jgi:hypothetical protein